MMDDIEPDWDPASPAAHENQIAAYDAVRARCPVAYSRALRWSLLGHAEVVRALEDHATFSNAVSAWPAVPNGMDPPEHTPFRRLIEPYFGPEAVAAFEPVCRRIADAVAARLPAGEVELMSVVAEDFALEAQCAFMGWPDTMHEPLREWIRQNAAANRTRHPQATAGVAHLFASLVHSQLDARREAGDAAPDDPTTRLLRDRVDGRPLTDAELVSIIRNWTVGELGTIAASIGIVMRFLAAQPALQDALRADVGGLDAAIDEMLRIDAPLIANRRITSGPVEIGGRRIAAGERLTLIWGSANRDEAVFGDPDAFEPERNRDRNLLYGAGIHVCPGAPLARLELRLIVAALLGRTRAIRPSDRPAVRATFPSGGFRTLPLRVELAGARSRSETI